MEAIDSGTYFGLGLALYNRVDGATGILSSYYLHPRGCTLINGFTYGLYFVFN